MLSELLSLLESTNSIITIFQIYDTIQNFSFSSSYLSLCIFHFLFYLTTSPARPNIILPKIALWIFLWQIFGKEREPISVFSCLLL